MSKIIIRNAHVKDNQPLTDIKIEDGKITELAARIISDTEDFKEIDVEGYTVLPTLIESHIHPDKAFLDERMPNVSGTLEEAMRNTAELKKKYTYDDVFQRSEEVIRRCIINGTTIIRAQPDVDPFEGTLGVEVMLDLKEKYKDILDMQIVAFPQEGVIQSPGVDKMLEDSLKMGADVIGACPYSEENMEGTIKQLEYIFDLAEKYDVPVDMHADFGTDPNDPLNNVIELICEMTIERGFQGKVSLGHVTTLGSLDPEKAAPIFRKIAKAGITIVPLPATDMYMNGRVEKKNIPRGMAPVNKMVEEGVNVVYSSNNIRNAFTPFGDADLITVGYLLQVSQQMGTEEQRRSVLDMCTYNAAKANNIEDYGIKVGANADLVVYESKDISNLINDQPYLRYVMKRGNIIVHNDIQTTVHPLLKSE